MHKAREWAKTHEGKIQVGENEILLNKEDSHLGVRFAAKSDEEHRFFRASDRLWLYTLSSASGSPFLQQLLDLFVEVGSMDAGMLRTREDNQLRMRATFGIDPKVAKLTIPVAEALPKDLSQGAYPSLIHLTSSEEKQKYIPSPPLLHLYLIPFLDRENLVAVLYLGTREGRELTEADQAVLSALAARAGTLLMRQMEYDTLRQGIRSRDEALATVAHDLRNPINVIALAANTLLHRLPDASAQRLLERIVRGAQRAGRLIQDLLDAHAMEDGRFSIEQRSVDALDMVLTALESQQGLAADASIILATDLMPDLPPLIADPERVLQVLENLIGNGVKFTSSGGTVTVGACAREGEILFWVKDNGAGIPEEHLPHLFDRFWQASKQDRRGTGLGLTICKAIVEAHGGRIWVDTEVGLGTTFYFTIPSDAQAEATQKVDPIANLLLVDDRPENLLSLKAILDRPNYRLVTATSGEEALRLALRDRFAVVLLDIAMPGMNGLEVAIHLKELERTRDIPLIFITAFGDDPQEVHRAYAAGGADYLVKPMDPEIVRKKVAVFVDLNRKRFERRRR